MTSAAPEQQIRRYLEQQGGQSEATVEHLLESFGTGEGDARGRAAITDALASVGVRLDRPLAGLAPHEPVTLWLAPARTGSPPPWAREAPAVVPPPWQTGESRGGAPRSALIAVAVLAALGAAAGGYLIGQGSGADLDRAHADGVQDGRRLAAASVDPESDRSDRRAGRRAADRAYDKAFAQAKAEVLAGAPEACGDVATSESPAIRSVRAQGVSCESARSFVSSARNCVDVVGECQGYTCENVQVAYEGREVTCTSGEAQIRYISGL
jgi:hypothetical protein